MKKLVIHKKIIEELIRLDNERIGMIVAWLILYNETGIQDEAPEKVAGVISKIQDIIKHNEDISEIRKKSGRKGGNPILLNQNFCLTKKRILLNQNDTNDGFCLTKNQVLDNQNEISDNIYNINNNIIDNNNILNNNKEKINKKESKKEKAEAELKKRAQKFYDSLIPYLDRYGKEMLRAFYDYWSEPNKSHSKMRFEQERTWDLGRRLARWDRNNTNKNYGTERKQSLDEKAAELINAYLNGSKDAGELSDLH